MAYDHVRLEFCSIFLLLLVSFYQSEAANAAFKKQVYASRTCGSPAETYFAVDQKSKSPRQRQESTCNASDPANAQPPSLLVDDNYSTFWQSKASVDTANITIDLRGPHRKYYYAYEIVIMFGLYFRPGKIAYLKSSDGGETFQPMHYFVSHYVNDNPTLAEQCQSYSVTANNRPARVNDVLCMTFPKATIDPEYMWNENISLSLTGQRGDISADGPGPSQELLEWMNVTHIQLQFSTLYRLFDPFAARWHHYAVREVSVNSFCSCNGHGNQNNCPYDSALGDRVCGCQIGSCGQNCDRCCSAYNQYPWKPGSKGPFIADKSAACGACNCHNHSSVCVYNETVATMKKSLDIHGNYSGGGVCQECKNHTTGINCEKCMEFYYRPRGFNKTAEDVCHDCACHVAGTDNVTLPGVVFLDCVRDQEEIPASRPHMNPGDCFCKNNTSGRQCDQCKPGFFNLSGDNPLGCQECPCHQPGTVNGSNICHPDSIGQCPCKVNVQGVKCDVCNDTYYDLQYSDPRGCKDCDCDIGGARSAVCNKDSVGQCPCVPNVTGRQCNRPEDEYYYPYLDYIGSPGNQGNKMWSAVFTVPSSANASGIYKLVLQYQSSLNVTVNITVSSTRKQLSHQVMLHSCQSTCSRLLSEFGELLLTGSVVVNVTFEVAHGQLVLQRVLAVPQEFYQPTVLGNGTMVEFLNNCSVFRSSVSDGGASESYCRSKIFSITMAYLQAAVACGCDSTGSHNNNCTKYGGQCHCKPGVTGRKCDQCIPGFYNFTTTGCTECGCYGDDKVCDVVTGQCKCPPNTIGRTCNKCNHSFWDLSPSRGCQSCNCSEVGSETLQCNLTTGLCSCKPGVTGDKCSHCALGYKDFSMSGCAACGCDVNGSLSVVCANSTGQCPCKNNSEGLTCSRCKAGHFYLNNANPEGCSECVCMGATTNCSSTTKYRYERQDQLVDWYLGEANTSARLQTVLLSLSNGGNSFRFLAANTSSTQTLYWKASTNYTRISMVGAYGGYFSFKVHITSLANGTLHRESAVILKGVRGLTIKHVFPPPTPDTLHSVSVLLKESSFVYTDRAGQVSRDDFMLVLARLEGILVSASAYYNGTGNYRSSFGSVSMDMVQESQSAEGRAYDVEQCHCSKEYDGLSCERCARSHYRVNVSGDPFLGKCVACNCNGHTEDCDPTTGKCFNCNHNTTGDNCEVCLDGFYGNATDGTSNDCKQCPCDQPKTTTSLCTGNALGQPQCLNCSVGYEGRLCDSCVLGFFGEPAKPGGNCSACQCNNNSDICHRTTGYCIDCKYNTTGQRCERCENGTYGDATKQQCQNCVCDGVGAYHNVCDHRTGECSCKPNVNGTNCSSCERFSYGFSESGCTRCECNMFGSTKLQCNESGVCECKNHTEGTKCDTCQSDFFGLPNKMCEACMCNMTGSVNSTVCNRTTGQCACKPGVTGRACDRCMKQHTNFSDTGCDACPACTRLGLQKDIDEINARLQTVDADIKKFDGLKKLKPALLELNLKIRNTRDSAIDFDKRVDTLQKGVADLKSNSLNKSIGSLRQQLSSLSRDATTLKQNTSHALGNMQKILNDSQAARNLTDSVSRLVQKIVSDLSALNDTASEMIVKAETFARHTYTTEEARAASALESAQGAHGLAMRARYNVSSQRNTSLYLQQLLLETDRNFSANNVEFTRQDRRIGSIASVLLDVHGLLNETKNLMSQADEIVASSRKVQAVITEILHNSSSSIETGRRMYERASTVVWGQQGLKARIKSLEGAISDAGPVIAATNRTVENASALAAGLMEEAQKMKSTFEAQKPHGARAVAAIKRYEEIVNTITESLNTSKNANSFIQDVNVRLRNITDSYPELENRARARSGANEAFLNTTLQRKIDFTGLRDNVTLAQSTFMKAITIGQQVDAQHATLISKCNALQVNAEVGVHQHSILTDSTNAITWSNMAGRNADDVISGAQALQYNVSQLEVKMQYINDSAESARAFVAEDFNSVANASNLLQNVSNNVQQVQQLRNETAKLRTELEMKMAILQEKLRLAKEKVAKIRLALSVQGSTSLQYGPSNRTKGNHFFNEISMDFRPSSVSRGILFHMSEQTSGLGGSLGLTVVQYGSTHYVRFSYNLGANLITITNYAVAVRSGDWFRVYATRYREKGRLTVTDLSRNLSRTMDSNTNQIIPDLQTNFDANSPVYLGGLPQVFLPNITDRFFDGCIDNVRVDQKNLELWKPLKVEGQRSFCSKGYAISTPDLISGTNFFGIKTGQVKHKMGSFNITGESEIKFQFRTFRNTSSLIAVRGVEDYLYQVYLNDSRVGFTFKSGNQSFTLLSELSSYSDGQWYEVHVMRRLRNVTMVIRPANGVGVTDHSTLGPFGREMRSRRGQALYFGGVDPQLLPRPVVSDSFAGGIRLLRVTCTMSNNSLVTRQLNGKNLESSNGVSFEGVLRDVTAGIRFIGGGFAGLETRQTVVRSLKLQFKTLQPSGLLAYSEKQSAYFYIALFHGNLFVLYTVNDSSVYTPLITTGQTLNDGAYHTIMVTSHAAGISVDVDNGRIQLSPDVSTVPPGPVPLNGVFYIGGVEPSARIPISVPVLQSFIGGVSFISVNDIIQDVFSGRSSEVSLAGVSPELTVLPTARPTIPPPTAPPPSCGQPNPPLMESNDPDIVTFGPANSYLGFMPTREVLDYIRYMGVVTIKFRALAPNGVLFYAANDLANPTYFVSLELISGRLVYKYKGQLGLLRVQTTFSNYSTGGIWYTARLLRICQFSAILIPETKDYNNKKEDEACSPLTINSPIYIGGVPDSVNKTVFESGGIGFIGAMKSAIIQSSNQTRTFNLVTDPSPPHTRRSNRTAYENIQAQAHFNGLSQLLLYDNFQLTSSFDISVKFSTTKRKGLLLSLGDTRGASTRNTAVTLEQLDGQIVLIFNDEHNSTTVRWTDPSIPAGGERNASYRLCDNKYHNVRIQKSEDVVTLTVDSHEPVVTRITQTNYYLRGNFYIGGVPDGEGAATHSGISKVRLTGCVSNLSINGKEIDIMRNPVSHNVQFGCPGR